MARLRFPGRPGYRFDRLGIRYGDDDAKNDTDPTLAIVANIHRGLRLFREVFGESDEEETFEGFSHKDVRKAKKKLAAFLDLGYSDEESNTELHGTRLASAKESLDSQPTSDRTRGRMKSVVRKSFKEIIKQGSDKPTKLHYVVKTQKLSSPKVPAKTFHPLSNRKSEETSKSVRHKKMPQKGKDIPQFSVTPHKTGMVPVVRASDLPRYLFSEPVSRLQEIKIRVGMHGKPHRLLRGPGRPSQLEVQVQELIESKSMSKKLKKIAMEKFIRLQEKRLEKKPKQLKIANVNEEVKKKPKFTAVPKIKRASKNVVKQILQKAKRGKKLLRRDSEESNSNSSSTSYQRREFVLPSQSSRSSRLIIPNKRLLEDESVHQGVKKGRLSEEFLSVDDHNFNMMAMRGSPGMFDTTQSFSSLASQKPGLFDRPLVVEGKRARKPSLKLRLKLFEDRDLQKLETRRMIEEKKRRMSDLSFEGTYLSMSPPKLHIQTSFSEQTSSKSKMSALSPLFPSPFASPKFGVSPFSQTSPPISLSSLSERRQLEELEREAEATRRSGYSILRKAKLRLNRKDLNSCKADLARSLKAQMKREAKQEKIMRQEQVKGHSCLPSSFSRVGRSAKSGKTGPTAIEKVSGNKRKYRKRVCGVCGDPMVTKTYYGKLVPACTECKHFFKFHMKQASKWENVCSGDGSCVINKSTKACIACRFKKCQEVFSSKITVQETRVVRSNKSYIVKAFNVVPTGKISVDTVKHEKEKTSDESRQVKIMQLPSQETRTEMDQTAGLKIRVGKVKVKIKSDTGRKTLSPKYSSGKSPEGKSAPGDIRGPRIKHVCRKAAVVLGRPLARFSSPSKITLSALPQTEKVKLLKEEEEAKAADSDDERPLEEIIQQSTDHVVTIPKMLPVKMTHKSKKQPILGKRKVRCRKCEGCLAPDCGKCVYCLDKPKFGGRNVCKQACIYRKCKYPTLARAATSAFIKPKDEKPKDDINKNITGVPSRGGNGENALRTNKLACLALGAGFRESYKDSTQVLIPEKPISEVDSQNNNDRIDSSNCKTKEMKTECRNGHGCDGTASYLNELPKRNENECNVSSAPLVPRFSSFHGNSITGSAMNRSAEIQQMKKGKGKDKAVTSKQSESPALRPGFVGARRTSTSLPVQHVIQANLRVSLDIEVAWEYGVALTMSGPLCVRTVCYLCGSAGKHDFIYCNICCEPYHDFCLEDCERPNIDNHDNWYCQRCQYCNVCGNQNNLLQCDKCQDTYHPECLGPNYPTKPSKTKKIWICTKCVRCKSCGATTPGVGWNATWTHDFSLCYECGQLMDKGNFCPICHKCYSDDDWESKMVQCASCESWVHAKCEGLTDEMYNRVSYLPEDIHYTCRICSQSKVSDWQMALQVEFLAGLRVVLSGLINSKCAHHLIKEQLLVEKKLRNVIQENDKLEIQQIEETIIKEENICSNAVCQISEVEQSVKLECTSFCGESKNQEENCLQTDVEESSEKINCSEDELKLNTSAATETDSLVEKSVAVESDESAKICDIENNDCDKKAETAVTKIDTPHSRQETPTPAECKLDLTRNVSDACDTEYSIHEESKLSKFSEDNLSSQTPHLLCRNHSCTVDNISIEPQLDSITTNISESLESDSKIEFDSTSTDFSQVEHSSESLLSSTSIAQSVSKCDVKLFVAKDSLIPECTASVVLSHDYVMQSQDSVTQSHDSVTQSHDSVTQSHDSVSKSHDSVTQSHDSVTQSHDSVSKSHDYVSKSHDSFSKSHDSVTQSHDSVTQSHDSVIQSHDSVTKSHDSVTKSHDSVTQSHDSVAICTSPSPSSSSQMDLTSESVAGQFDQDSHKAEVTKEGTDLVPYFGKNGNCNDNILESKDIKTDSVSPSSNVHFMEGKRIQKITPTRPMPSDLEAVQLKIDSLQYQTVEEFSEDIVYIIQAALDDDQENNQRISRRKANVSVRSVFLKQMDKCFPWFNVKACQLWEKNRNLPEGMLEDAVLPPSDDHTYAQWLCQLVIPLSPQPSPFKRLINTPLKRTVPCALNDNDSGRSTPVDQEGAGDDNRRCILCWMYGDDHPDDAGRLLYVGQDDWCHTNCALWSAEVFEDSDGSLQNVQTALKRGKQMKCERCSKSGATVGCCTRGCPSNFHFRCAKAENCVFQEDKKVFCKYHEHNSDGELVTKGMFEVHRRVCIDYDNAKWLKKSWMKGINAENVNVLLGSCTVDYLGKLSPLSDQPSVLFPVDYCCTRIYWSTIDARKRCVYTCKIVEVKPDSPEAPKITPRDMRIVHDQSHPDYVPFSQLDLSGINLFDVKDGKSLEREVGMINSNDSCLPSDLSRDITMDSVEDNFDILSESTESSSSPGLQKPSLSQSINSSTDSRTENEKIDDVSLTIISNSANTLSLSSSWPQTTNSPLKSRERRKSSDDAEQLAQFDLNVLSPNTLRCLNIKNPEKFHPSVMVKEQDTVVDVFSNLTKVVSRLNRAAERNSRLSSEESLSGGRNSRAPSVERLMSLPPSDRISLDTCEQTQILSPSSDQTQSAARRMRSSSLERIIQLPHITQRNRSHSAERIISPLSHMVKIGEELIVKPQERDCEIEDTDCRILLVKDDDYFLVGQTTKSLSIETSRANTDFDVNVNNSNENITLEEKGSETILVLGEEFGDITEEEAVMLAKAALGEDNILAINDGFADEKSENVVFASRDVTLHIEQSEQKPISQLSNARSAVSAEAFKSEISVNREKSTDREEMDVTDTVQSSCLTDLSGNQKCNLDASKLIVKLKSCDSVITGDDVPVHPENISSEVNSREQENDDIVDADVGHSKKALPEAGRKLVGDADLKGKLVSDADFKGNVVGDADLEGKLVGDADLKGKLVSDADLKGNHVSDADLKADCDESLVSAVMTKEDIVDDSHHQVDFITGDSCGDEDQWSNQKNVADSSANNQKDVDSSSRQQEIDIHSNSNSLHGEFSRADNSDEEKNVENESCKTVDVNRQVRTEYSDVMPVFSKQGELIGHKFSIMDLLSTRGIRKTKKFTKMYDKHQSAKETKTIGTKFEEEKKTITCFKVPEFISTTEKINSTDHQTPEMAEDIIYIESMTVMKNEMIETTSNEKPNEDLMKEPNSEMNLIMESNRLADRIVPDKNIAGKTSCPVVGVPLENDNRTEEEKREVLHKLGLERTPTKISKSAYSLGKSEKKVRKSTGRNLFQTLNKQSPSDTLQKQDLPLHDKIVQRIKAESLAKSNPGRKGPFKCPTCKRLYRTRESFKTHVAHCDFEVSTSDEEEDDDEKKGDGRKTHLLRDKYPLRSGRNVIESGIPSFTPKHSPETDNLHVKGKDIELISPIKRKRGRPKIRENTEQDNASDDDAHSPSVKKMCLRSLAEHEGPIRLRNGSPRQLLKKPTSSNVKNVNISTSEPELNTEKHCRGRPRKTLNLSENNVKSDLSMGDIKKMDRGKQHLYDTTSSIEVKRGRGRPKRNCLIASDSKLKTLDRQTSASRMLDRRHSMTDCLSRVKQGRGRPRKISADNVPRTTSTVSEIQDKPNVSQLLKRRRDSHERIVQESKTLRIDVCRLSKDKYPTLLKSNDQPTGKDEKREHQSLIHSNTLDTSVNVCDDRAMCQSDDDDVISNADSKQRNIYAFDDVLSEHGESNKQTLDVDDVDDVAEPTVVTLCEKTGALIDNEGHELPLSAQEIVDSCKPGDESLSNDSSFVKNEATFDDVENWSKKSFENMHSIEGENDCAIAEELENTFALKKEDSTSEMSDGQLNEKLPKFKEDFNIKNVVNQLQNSEPLRPVSSTMFDSSHTGEIVASDVGCAHLPLKSFSPETRDENLSPNFPNLHTLLETEKEMLTHIDKKQYLGITSGVNPSLAVSEGTECVVDLKSCNDKIGKNVPTSSNASHCTVDTKAIDLSLSKVQGSENISNTSLKELSRIRIVYSTPDTESTVSQSTHGNKVPDCKATSTETKLLMDNSTADQLDMGKIGNTNLRETDISAQRPRTVSKKTSLSPSWSQSPSQSVIRDYLMRKSKEVERISSRECIPTGGNVQTATVNVQSISTNVGSSRHGNPLISSHADYPSITDIQAISHADSSCQTILSNYSHSMESLPVSSTHLVNQPVTSTHLINQPVSSPHLVNQPIRSPYLVTQPIRSAHLVNQPISIKQEENGEVTNLYSGMLEPKNFTDCDVPIPACASSLLSCISEHSHKRRTLPSGPNQYNMLKKLMDKEEERIQERFQKASKSRLSVTSDINSAALKQEKELITINKDQSGRCIKGMQLTVTTSPVSIQPSGTMMNSLTTVYMPTVTATPATLFHPSAMPVPVIQTPHILSTPQSGLNVDYVGSLILPKSPSSLQGFQQVLATLTPEQKVIMSRLRPDQFQEIVSLITSNQFKSPDGSMSQRIPSVQPIVGQQQSITNLLSYQGSTNISCVPPLLSNIPQSVVAYSNLNSLQTVLPIFQTSDSIHSSAVQGLTKLGPGTGVNQASQGSGLTNADTRLPTHQLSNIPHVMGKLPQIDLTVTNPIHTDLGKFSEKVKVNPKTEQYSLSKLHSGYIKKGYRPHILHKKRSTPQQISGQTAKRPFLTAQEKNGIIQGYLNKDVARSVYTKLQQKSNATSIQKPTSDVTQPLKKSVGTSMRKKATRRIARKQTSVVLKKNLKPKIVGPHSGLAKSHPMIHPLKDATLPQPAVEEEIVETPLYEFLEHSEQRRKRLESEERKKGGPKLMFEITSDDGFHCRSPSMEAAWKLVTEKVQDARATARMKYLNFSSVSGVKMFGLSHSAVIYLLEQLSGARCCSRYRFRYYEYEKEELEQEPAENSTGCIRAEPFKTRKPHDMFSFLMSKYRNLPEIKATKSNDLMLTSSRRATSMELPMAMRFRHLQAHSKEAVGVYRSSIHGRGLYCKRNIDAGEMVIEYAGEVIRSALTDKREKYYESRAIGCYMFRIDDVDVVDATMHGSPARFINHSCEPNCYSKVINVDGKKHIVIFAMRAIQRGEELTYDYKFPIEDIKIPCTCGTKRCRKYLN